MPESPPTSTPVERAGRVANTVRVTLPSPLRALAKCGSELAFSLTSPVSLHDVIDAIEHAYPMLRGTIREREGHTRRPFVRFYADSRDLSHTDLRAPLPESVASGRTLLLIIGAMAGG